MNEENRKPERNDRKRAGNAPVKKGNPNNIAYKSGNTSVGSSRGSAPLKKKNESNSGTEPGKSRNGRMTAPIRYDRKGQRRKPAFAEKNAPVEGLAARRAALKVLRQVTEEGAYASLSLDKALQGSGMNAADRRLTSRLVYDTLDHLIYLDHMIAQVMAREDTDIKLRNILRLGACQLLLEDRIPESAATNTSVALCTELGMEGLKGVCNGILRNLIRKKTELTLPDPEKEPDLYFSVRHSVPEWLARRLRTDYGDEAEAVASFRKEENTITIRPNLTKLDDPLFEKLLEKKIWGKQKTDIPHAWKITGAMDIARDRDFQEGGFSIQSESSMMVCQAMEPGRGKQLLDCCAAPGGKTCYLAEMMGGTGRIQAWDIHEHRVDLISAQAKRLGLENIRPCVRDATKPREALYKSMDGVLLDAPCSGLGVMAEKPDIKLRITENSVKSLIELQKVLLDTVCEYVKEGGLLVYSTCSVLKEENELQTEAFLRRHPEYEAVSLPDSIPERFRRYEKTGLQLLEYRDGVEGFYICRMRRRSV